MKKNFGKIILSLKVIRNLVTFVFDLFGLVKGDIVYKLRNGVKMTARAGTSDAAEIIIINSDSEYPKRFFPLNNKPIVIDVGAHIGSFSVYAGLVLRPKSPLIYAIEPSRENFLYLAKNIKQNSFTSMIKPFNLAISTDDKRYLVFPNKDYDCMFLAETKSGKKCEKVNTVTIERFCKNNNINNIDLIKIDIEGEEHNLFEKSISFFQKRVRSILVEVHHRSVRQSICKFEEFIKNRGFGIEAKINDRVFFLRNLKLI